MTLEPTPPSARTAARTLATRWPGLVWAAPMAALMVVLYLGLNRSEEHTSELQSPA